MKKRPFLLAGLLLSAVTMFNSCIDKENFGYNRDTQEENPLEGITVPDGFDWKTLATIDVNVTAKGYFNGAYKYTMEIFDENPEISQKANLILKGFVENGQTFSAKVTIPAAIGEVFVRQTDPTGAAVVRKAAIKDNSLNCDFASQAGATQARTRAGENLVDIPNINWSDAALFPQAAPTENLVEIIGAGNWKGDNTKNYLITGNTTAITNYAATGIKFYVTEDVTISTITNNLKAQCYILPGVKLTLDVAEVSLSSWTFSIGEGAELKVTGLFKPSDGHVYNKGTITATTLHTTYTAQVYNAGTINLSGEGEKKGLYIDSNSKIFNFADITAKDYSTSAFGITYNDSGAEVVIDGMTYFPGGTTTWINNGSWITENASSKSCGNTYINKCKFIINELFSITEGTFINDINSYVGTKDFYMHKGKFRMESGSFIDVTGTATLAENTKANEEGFLGVGSDGKALVRMATATTTEAKYDRMINYEGNLQVACSNHPSDEYKWTVGEEVEWAEYNAPTIVIPTTGCNPGIGGGEAPGENEPIVDPYTYSFVFEDFWPLYGDYDMNDVVVYVDSITKDEKGKKLSFEYSLRAVGANKSIAAALMLDEIATADVKSISYDNNAPTSFNTGSNGAESGQDYAVVPLFDNAHAHIGVSGNPLVNTIKGSEVNVADEDLPVVKVEIEFEATADLSDLDISKFNLFIISDINETNVKQTDRKEIHMIGYAPSKMGNTELFGANDDRSSVANKDYYISRDNLTWGIVIPDKFKWPTERTSIRTAYGQFEAWVTSGGANNADWYKHPSGSVY